MLVDDLKRACARLAKGDFLEPVATEEERQELQTAPKPIIDAQVQDYVAWRRSLLLIAAILVGLGVLFDVVGFKTVEDQVVEQATAQTEAIAKNQGQAFGRSEAREVRRRVVKNLGEDNLETLDVYGIAMILGAIAAAVLVALSASRWREIRGSRKFARIAWLVSVGTPLALSIIPWPQFLDFSHLGDGAKAAQGTMALIFSLQVLITLAPKLISVFPGLMRAGMTLKTLFHESATPAYVTTLAAPIFAMLLLVVFSTIIQIDGQISLFLAVMAFLGSAAVYLWKSQELLRSHTREEAARGVKGVRRLASMFSIVGVVCLVWFLFDNDQVSITKALSFLIHAGGSLVLTMVVGADFLLIVLAKEYAVAKQFQGSEFAEAYERKMDALTAVGMTRMASVTMNVPLIKPTTENADASEPPAPPPPPPPLPPAS